MMGEVKESHLGETPAWTGQHGGECPAHRTAGRAWKVPTLLSPGRAPELVVPTSQGPLPWLATLFRPGPAGVQASLAVRAGATAQQPAFHTIQWKSPGRGVPDPPCARVWAQVLGTWN